jgi:hypothetical protein
MSWNLIGGIAIGIYLVVAFVTGFTWPVWIWFL